MKYQGEITISGLNYLVDDQGNLCLPNGVQTGMKLDQNGGIHEGYAKETVGKVNPNNTVTLKSGLTGTWKTNISNIQSNYQYIPINANENLGTDISKIPKPGLKQGQIDYQKLYDYIDKTIKVLLNKTNQNLKQHLANVNSQPLFSALNVKNHFASESDEYCWFDWGNETCRPDGTHCIAVGIKVCIPGFKIIPYDSLSYIKNQLNQTVNLYNGDIWDFTEDSIANLTQSWEISNNNIYKAINDTIEDTVKSLDKLSTDIKDLHQYVDDTVAAGVLTAEEDIKKEILPNAQNIQKAVKQWMANNNISTDNIKTWINNDVNDFLTTEGLTADQVNTLINTYVTDYLRKEGLTTENIDNYLNNLLDTSSFATKSDINGIKAQISDLQKQIDKIPKQSNSSIQQTVNKYITNNYTITGMTADQIKELIKANLPKVANEQEKVAHAIINWLTSPQVTLNVAAQVIPFVNEIQSQLSSPFKQTTIDINNYKNTIDNWIDDKIKNLQINSNIDESKIDTYIDNYVKAKKLDLTPYKDKIYNLIKDKIPTSSGAAPIYIPPAPAPSPSTYDITKDKDTIISWIDNELTNYSIDITKYKDTILSWLTTNSGNNISNTRIKAIQSQIDDINTKLSNIISSIPDINDFFKWMSELDLSKWYSLKALWMKILSYVIEPEHPITESV